MSVYVLVCETRPLPVYSIVFWHPGLLFGRKHSLFHLIHHHVCSFLLVSLIWQPACESSLRRRGRVKKPPLQYFEFRLHYLVQPLGVNPTCSTFKVLTSVVVLRVEESTVHSLHTYNPHRYRDSKPQPFGYNLTLLPLGHDCPKTNAGSSGNVFFFCLFFYVSTYKLL